MIYLPEEEGQGLIEYGLILVLIAIAVVALVAVFGGQVEELYSEITSKWPG
jgi:pilus assembly protein Flp/PilA